jgi:uncharacterized membrane protein YeaQ/YmgE (transglycosylase-associated protein family)
MKHIKSGETAMTILTWIVLGVLAGWGAHRMMGSGSYGVVGDIVVGTVGAVASGWLGSVLLPIDLTAITLSGVAVSLGGAAIAIAVFRALTPDRPWWQAWRNL